MQSTSRAPQPPKLPMQLPAHSGRPGMFWFWAWENPSRRVATAREMERMLAVAVVIRVPDNKD